MSVWPNWFLINDFFKGGGGDIFLVGIFNKKGQINPNFINLNMTVIDRFLWQDSLLLFFYQKIRFLKITLQPPSCCLYTVSIPSRL